MPIISMFYGIIVSLYYFDNKQHSTPHIHVRFQEDEIVINILTSETLNGFIPANKLKLVLAWIEIHKDELIADWSLAVEWKEIFKIEPLK
jgi:hypothetical protein